jgi:hypothetical protein
MRIPQTSTKSPSSLGFHHVSIPPVKLLRSIKRQVRLLFVAALLSAAPLSPCAELLTPSPDVSQKLERPLRYRPEGTDFVIENGTEFFNRPLYCLNSAFRIDGGDKPEFSLYLPGRGGNLRLGIKTSAGTKWLHAAENIKARYRPGSMLYEIRDPLLGDEILELSVLPMSEAKGLVMKVAVRGPKAEDRNPEARQVELVLAYGGANGMRGSRGGDIGCEREPVSRFFQLRPEQCRSNSFSVVSNAFVLRSKVGTLAGVMPAGAKVGVADATHWEHLEDLLGSRDKPTELPVAVAATKLKPGTPAYLAIQVASDNARTYTTEELSKIFATSEEHRRAVAERVTVETPDPFINAAASALCVAADGIWDANEGLFMHGAVAWRTRFLGWRGPYSGDDLGWHDRTAKHLAYYAARQNTNPVPEIMPGPDPAVNLTRNEAALHSNGDMTHSHYDMNLVGIDALFRHLRWTADLEFAKQMWPVVKRHLAWERRLFRRPFGPEQLPLYEAYCCIWASDNMQYDGAGVAHSTAYNYFHNKMAAQLAPLMGEDADPFGQEAELIAKAMRTELWLPEKGWFGECKDYLGLQMVHPNSGLWTFYHTIDSEVPTPFETWEMSRFVDTQIMHIPVIPITPPSSEAVAGSLRGNFYTLPTSSWMPYMWSINNVVMAEVAHTALGYWQAGRPDPAMSIFKGCLLDSMYLGLCPGNVGMCTWYDKARGESQRDFGDGIGMMSRALVEGLFGIRPDAFSGELVLQPGFPSNWDHAKLKHPDLDFSFDRKDLIDTFVIVSRFPKPMSLRLQLPARQDRVAEVTVNGKSTPWNLLPESVGSPRIEIKATPSPTNEIMIEWAGAPLEKSKIKNQKSKFSQARQGDMSWWEANTSEVGPKREAASTETDWKSYKIPPENKFETVELSPAFNDSVTRIFKNDYFEPRSPFCSLQTPRQGLGGWCDFNLECNVDDSGLRQAAVTNSGVFRLPQGIPFRTGTEAGAKNIAFVSHWTNYTAEISIPLHGKASHAYLLMAGSTGPMQSQFANGEVIFNYADGSSDRLVLKNPTTWWPIDQDYFLDELAFRADEPLPLRVDLKTGRVRLPEPGAVDFKGGKISGGSATVLDITLNPDRELKSLTVRALANEVVVGLMALTLVRD